MPVPHGGSGAGPRRDGAGGRRIPRSAAMTARSAGRFPGPPMWPSCSGTPIAWPITSSALPCAHNCPAHISSLAIA